MRDHSLPPQRRAFSFKNPKETMEAYSNILKKLSENTERIATYRNRTMASLFDNIRSGYLFRRPFTDHPAQFGW